MAENKKEGIGLLELLRDLEGKLICFTFQDKIKNSKKMGWDAHTNTKKNWNKNQLSNKEQRKAFKQAFEFVKSEFGQVDGYLDMAALDCSACAKMLEKATGRDCWGEDWKSSEIQSIYEKSNWDFEFNKEEAWAYYSAKKFLELCAKFKLTVKFSW